MHVSTCSEILVKFQACGHTLETVPPRKVVGTILLMLVRFFKNIFLSFAFVTSLNRAVTMKPPLGFQCQFSRSSWTYCWLPLARSTDYCGRLVTSTLPPCNFSGLPLLVLPLQGVESVLV